MAYLEELSKYKNIVAEKLISDMDLCKAVYYNEENFLDQADIPTASTLIYRNIFPYGFIPNTQSEMLTYIGIHCKFKFSSSQYKLGTFFLDVYTHRDLFKTDYGSTRIDYILNRIDRLLNYQNILGIGKLQFNETQELVVNDKFQGATISYLPVDFNR